MCLYVGFCFILSLFLFKDIKVLLKQPYTFDFQIEGEGGKNEEVGKNTAIRNFIETKSSNDLVKISTKLEKKYFIKEVLYQKVEYFINTSISCFIVIRKQFCAMWKKQHVQQKVLRLYLGFTLSLSTVHVS